MRSRIIKPGFWSNELLAELTIFARLLFVGLWCLADREGRLEDRPKRIRAMLFPYDNADGMTEQALVELEDRGFILRYTVDEKSCIQVTNFAAHQHTHLKEAPSVLPPPPKSSKPKGEPEDAPEDKPAEGPTPSEQVEAVVALYHQHLPMLPKVQKVTSARFSQVRARLNEYGMDGLEAICKYLAGSKFHQGDNNTKWRADFDWIMGPKNAAKLYDRAMAVPAKKAEAVQYFNRQGVTP